MNNNKCPELRLHKHQKCLSVKEIKLVQGLFTLQFNIYLDFESILDVSNVQVNNAAQSNISAMLKVEIDLPIVCGHSRQGGCKHNLHEFQSLE